jgi:hypothetical protein
MLNKIVLTAVASFCIASSLSADKIKTEMGILSNSLSSVQRAFMEDDRDKSIRLLADLKISIHKVLGSERKVLKLLPKELQDKKNIALNTGKIINENIDKIQAIYFDESLTNIQAQIQSQELILDIERQCFKCHNLVRDWDKGAKK